MKPKKFVLFFYGPRSKKWILFRSTNEEAKMKEIVAKHLHPALTAFPPYTIQIRKIYK